jgi:hypothetical protein
MDCRNEEIASYVVHRSEGLGRRLQLLSELVTLQAKKNQIEPELLKDLKRLIGEAKSLNHDRNHYIHGRLSFRDGEAIAFVNKGDQKPADPEKVHAIAKRAWGLYKGLEDILPRFEKAIGPQPVTLGTITAGLAQREDSPAG